MFPNNNNNNNIVSNTFVIFTIINIVFSSTTSLAGSSPKEAFETITSQCPHISPNSYTPNCPFFSTEQLDPECEILQLALSMSPDELIFIDDKAQRMGINGYVAYEWQSKCQIVGQLNEISKGNSSILQRFLADEKQWWIPSISHTNTEMDYDMTDFGNRLILALQGNDTVVSRYKKYGLFVSHCDLDLTHFPYDIQNCSIDLVIQQDPTIFNVTIDPCFECAIDHEVRAEIVSESMNWLLTNVGSLCSVTDVNLRPRWKCQFWFAFKRKPAYYMFNFILPQVLLTFFLLLTFSLKVDCCERSGFALTIVLTLTFMRSDVLSVLPESSSYSRMSMYSDGCCCLALTITAYFLLIYFYSNQQSTKKTACKLSPVVLDWFALILCSFTFIFLVIYFAATGYILSSKR